MIVQRLRAIQNRFGYLPDAELAKLAEEIGEPLYRIEEVSSFFPAYRRERDKPPGLLVRVCRDLTCHHRGAAALTESLADPKFAQALSRSLHETRVKETEAKNQQLKAAGKKLLPLPTAEDCRIAVEGVSCLGRCDRAPAVWVERHPMPHLEYGWVWGGLELVPKDGEHPHGDHAWVYAGRDEQSLKAALKRLAGGGDAKPDADAKYAVNTTAGTAVLTSTTRPYPDWEIDYYAWARTPRNYDAVRLAAEFLAGLGNPLRPPSEGGGKKLSERDLDAFVESNHPILWRLKQSGLLGMGGAGAPAYTKWRDVWNVPGDEKYIVANGDESEPGTFKDRELLLRVPHLVVEGVILAGLLTGATHGFIFIRHEYHEQIAAVEAEIARAERLGACGGNVFGSGLRFPVEAFESPGGYILGEQSALLEAMEDRRGQPRNRPPELGTNGLRDKPTVVNNIETLSWAPSIVLRGETAPDYATAGWQVPGSAGPTPLRFAGRRLFSVSGDVNRPGVYEVPVGLPFGELLDNPKYCGGVAGELAAVAPSGPSGGLLPARIPIDPTVLDRVPDALKRIADRSKTDAAIMEWFVGKYLPAGSTHLDLKAIPLDLVFFRNLDAVLRLPVEPMLGAGIAVYAGPIDALEHAVNFTRFFRNESCGKCVPCRIGTEKLTQLGTDLLAGRATAGGVKPLIQEMYKTLQQTSICGLGYVAPIPLNSALVYFAPPPDGRKSKA